MKKIKNFIYKLRRLLNYDFDNVIKNNTMINNQITKISNELQEVNINVQKLVNSIELFNNQVIDIDRNINQQISNKLTNIDSEISLLQILSRKNDLKKILLCGFYGALNLGDELMIDVLLKKIRKIGNFDITIMLCKNFYFDISKYDDVSIIYYPDKTGDFAFIAENYDVLIFGGGALIDDTNFQSFDEITLGRILIDLTTQFIKRRKTTILYGLSTNFKFVDSDFVQKLSYVCKNVSYISLRDENSLKTLKDNNIKSHNIKIVNDIVFCNDYSKFFQKNKLSDKKMTIGLVYVCFNELKEKILNITNKIITYFDENNIYISIKLIPFYGYNQNDYQFYKSIIENIDFNDIVIERNPNNLDELCRTLNKCDIIFSMRYHCTLISNILNIKTVCINYDSHKHYTNKNKYLYEKYKFDKNIINFSSEITMNDINQIVKKDNKYVDITEVTKESNQEVDDALKFLKES